jgi:hypothetical protein
VTIAASGQTNQSSDGQNFGGFGSLTELVNAVVYWIPKISLLLLSRYQGKYAAWSSSSDLAFGAQQNNANNPSFEEEILDEWSSISQSRRYTIMQYALSYRIAGPSCARKYVRNYTECAEIVRYKGRSFCKRASSSSGDICNQSSAPSICRRVISQWKGVGDCDSLPDPIADKFFSWLTARVVSGEDTVKKNNLKNFYLNGIPRKKR